MISTRQLLLLGIPAILIATGALVYRVKQYQELYPEEPTKIQTKSFTIPIFPTDPILGNPKAPKTIIFFSDILCESCHEEHKTLNTLLERHPKDVRVVWKGLSVNRIPISSAEAHQYAFCAQKQGRFEPFLEALMKRLDTASFQRDMLTEVAEEIQLSLKTLDTCLKDPATTTAISYNEIIARALQVQAVPSFFVNNTQIQAPRFVEGWETILGL